MIGLLKGTIQNVHTNPLLVVVGGVGYRVAVPDHVRTKLTESKTETLYIHTHVSDDAIALYGFIVEDDLTLFELLLTVGGIGPRTGLAIISRGATQIQKAISEGDVDFFMTIPRLGKKNAQKIIIELKTKLGSIKDLDLKNEGGETTQIREALESMGFERKDVVEAIKHLDGKATSVEAKIRQLLKYLGKP